MHISWARLASFCHLGFISDPLIVSKFHNETHDPKGQENKIYSIMSQASLLQCHQCSTMLNNFDPVNASSYGSIESAHFADWPEPSLLNNFDPVYANRLTTFPCGVLIQVMCLIVPIPDFCLFTYLYFIIIKTISIYNYADDNLLFTVALSERQYIILCGLM